MNAKIWSICYMATILASGCGGETIDHRRSAAQESSNAQFEARKKRKPSDVAEGGVKRDRSGTGGGASSPAKPERHSAELNQALGDHIKNPDKLTDTIMNMVDTAREHMGDNQKVTVTVKNTDNNGKIEVVATNTGNVYINTDTPSGGDTDVANFQVNGNGNPTSDDIEVERQGIAALDKIFGDQTDTDKLETTVKVTKSKDESETKPLEEGIDVTGLLGFVVR